ncbi:MAG: hypothetical protein K2X47_02920 [Bdellovibrionales bacterium]|nr:hypothetical protein [Bdellovibrionales bacterium]
MTHLTKVLFLLFLGIQAWSLPSHALIDARAFVGLNTVNPGDLNKITSPPVSLAGLLAYGAEVIVAPPLLGVGFGLRYEAAGQKVETGSASLDIKATRIAGVVNYRLIETGLFLGPIATVGLSHTLSASAAASTAGTSFSGSNATSFSLGVEGGVNLLGLILGAEVGYQSWIVNEIKDNGGAVVANTKADLSGLYARAVVGFGF